MPSATPVSGPAAELTRPWVARVPLQSSGSSSGFCVTGERGRFLSSVQRRSSAAMFSGHLHNRQALISILGKPGESLDEAELMLRAYERWGQECPVHIRGIFAAVILDSERETVFAARDRIGVHPLFWSRAGSALVFSSSIDALVSDPGVSRAPNRSAMVDHIRHTWGDHPTETFFDAVQRVPAGHAFEASMGRIREWPYWHVLKPDRVISWMSEEESESFDSKLDEAVERCLELGPSAIFLSGGLDSVSVAASAIDITRRTGRPAPLALSLAFPHPECNEEVVQRGVASGLGISQVLYPFEDALPPDGMIESGLAMTRRMGAPLMNPWEPAYHRLRVEARQHECQVIMTGNGGDDWLAVDPLHVADLIRHGHIRDLVELLRNDLKSYDVPRIALLRRMLWGYGLRPIIARRLARILERVAPTVLDAHRRRRQASVTPAWLAPDADLRRESVHRFAKVAERIRKRPNPTGPYGFFALEGPTGFIRPSMAMEFEEQFEFGRMTQTLELAPYWDADLVEFLHRIPPKILDQGGRSKGLVRASVARRLPGLGFDRQRKVSAVEYLTSVLATAGSEAWKRSGGATELARLGVVGADLSGFAQRAFESRDSVRMQQILDIMQLEAWARAKAA